MDLYGVVAVFKEFQLEKVPGEVPGAN